MKIICVMSGKGGVGKTTMTCLLSHYSSENYKTLILDFDISGPSLKNILPTNQKVTKSEKGLNPINIKHNLDALSMSYLVKDTDAIIWRGPKKLSILNLFFSSIDGYERVFIDMPPGLSEEHSFLKGKDVQACIVTTPQNMSLNDAATSLDFCKNNNIRVECIIENMSGYECEKCKCNINVFGKGGARFLGEKYGVENIVTVKLDSMILNSIEAKTFVHNYNEFTSLDELKGIFE